MISEQSSVALSNSRYEGVDLLRIVAMFMVLFLHILGSGGIIFEVEALSPNGITAWFFEMAAYSAINCYGVISGFVGVHSKYKYSNLVYLWLQVTLYCAGITLIYCIRYPQAFPLSVLWESLFPVCNGKYWYFTAYVGLFFVMPLLNMAVKNLKKAQLRAILLGLFMLFSVLPSIFRKDIFMTCWGYGVLWLCFLYLVGAYIRLHGLFNNNQRLALLLYGVCVVISWLIKMGITPVSTEGKYEVMAADPIAQYTSPAVFLAGVMLFVAFCGIKLPQKVKNVVSVVSPCAFGVYIIHAHFILWNRLITYKYVHFINYSPLGMMVAVFLTAICMFTVLAFIDFIRLQIFNLLKIKPLLQKAENKLLGNLWN